MARQSRRLTTRRPVVFARKATKSGAPGRPFREGTHQQRAAHGLAIPAQLACNRANALSSLVQRDDLIIPFLARGPPLLLEAFQVWWTRYPTGRER